MASFTALLLWRRIRGIFHGLNATFSFINCKLQIYEWNIISGHVHGRSTLKLMLHIVGWQTTVIIIEYATSVALQRLLLKHWRVVGLLGSDVFCSPGWERLPLRSRACGGVQRLSTLFIPYRRFMIRPFPWSNCFCKNWSLTRVIKSYLLALGTQISSYFTKHWTKYLFEWE